MPQQFTVPQFIDVEDKIFGPISVRQFVVILGGGFIEIILYFASPFVIFIILGLIVLGLIVLFAFFKINGQYFHIFLINLATTVRQPKLQLWKKSYDPKELEEKKKETAPPGIVPPRASPTSSRLQELALIVDTGGAYGEESWEIAKEDKDIV
ncbi:MAG: PrgI family protein [Patescibacteria group bacterium]|nr:PrgI family protein [Patescibacteria group bacterium]